MRGMVAIRGLLWAVLFGLFATACNGDAGGDGVQVAETRADGEDLDENDEAAAGFLRGKLEERFVKTDAGWTTQFQMVNMMGQPMPDRVPPELFRQIRELSFTIDQKPLTESMKLNGSDYRAEATFKNTSERFYHTEASYEAQGWGNWRDAALGYSQLAIERRNGQWIMSSSDLFDGIKPIAPIPD